MITRLTLRNFKSVKEEVYDFTQFDLLVGRNNSGKSTVLQALAIWQFCVDEFSRSKRGGSKGIQVVLPNFTALPLPEFNLLWKNRTDRAYPVDEKSGKRKQEFILIEILVEWPRDEKNSDEFGVELRYQTPQTIYAVPQGGWARFRQLEREDRLPRTAYVPPFSGLETNEKWLDDSPIRQQVGKGQPGSVLRNLLLRVGRPTQGSSNDKDSRDKSPPPDWRELASTIERWFSVQIHEPRYESAKDVYISVEYLQGDKDFDIIAGGSGFHQTLTLLAFMYGYHPTTILLDEPDAHLHVNLQREILDYFKRKSLELGTQFIIATHAEEFVRGVDATQILSLLTHQPKRIQSAPEVLRAMAEVSNDEIARLITSPYILYVEGESDERILRAWANACGAEEAMDKLCFKSMRGGDKARMKKDADRHFEALKQIIPTIVRLMLFDYDEDSTYHPPPDNPRLNEWGRKNIENYLLVPDAWKRAALQQLKWGEDALLAYPVLHAIDTFFAEQNLTLPPGRTWRDVSANVFSVVDGKQILFEGNDSLFQTLRAGSTPLELLRERVAMNMTAEEIHEDVHRFMDKALALVSNSLAD